MIQQSTLRGWEGYQRGREKRISTRTTENKGIDVGPIPLYTNWLYEDGWYFQGQRPQGYGDWRHNQLDKRVGCHRGRTFDDVRMEYASMSQYWLDNKMDTIKDGRRWQTAWYGGIVEEGEVVQRRGRGMKGSGNKPAVYGMTQFRISSSNNIISSNN